jgi:uncharacterized membrane protein (DUF4010 family)
MLASHEKIPAAMAGVGAVLASLASALVNLMLVARFSRPRRLTVRTGMATLLVLAVGLAGAAVSLRWTRTG